MVNVEVKSSIFYDFHHTMAELIDKMEKVHGSF